MSAYDVEHLYDLMPAWIRLRDQTEGGGSLKALLGVVAKQAEIIADGLDQLYDDQFIETCAPWVVPYIGDLIGFLPLGPIGPGEPAATRAEVADTIGYRRRKGTLAVLERLASDVSGWPAVGVEYFARLAGTQYVRNHLRPQNAVVDVRSPMTAIDSGTAFDRAPRGVDVRRISSGRGRYNIPNVGIFVWRLRGYRTVGGPAARVGFNRYTFDPFGGDVPLVNPVALRASEFAVAERPDVPFLLKRYPLFAGVADYSGAPPFAVYVAGKMLDPLEFEICDLSAWNPPTQPGVLAAVDPELGRIVFALPAPAATDTIRVDYHYAFSGDYGCGNYVAAVAPDEATLEAEMSVRSVASFAADDLSSDHHGVVAIEDGGIHAGAITITPDAQRLVVRAGDDPPPERPILTGKLTITAVDGASVTLRGLGLGGGLAIGGTGSLNLRLEHCTLRGPLDWTALVDGALVIDHSLCGAVEANGDVDVTISDSVLDGGSDASAALSGGGGSPCGSVTLARSTVFGTIDAREIPLLENSIVTGLVRSVRVQGGCVRYSFIRASQAGQSARTPRRYRCQPDWAIDNAVSGATAVDPALDAAGRAAIAARVAAWLVPTFASRTPGQPGYAQLADAAPDEVRRGAQDGDEMGVFFGLFGPRRERNLEYRLREYLRIGLEVGIVHAS